MLPSLARRKPQLRYNFHTRAKAFLSSLSLLSCSNLSLVFCLVVHQPYDAGKNALPRLCNPFLFCKIDTREDANIHKAIACQCLSKNICTFVGEWTHDYFCLGYFSSSTHFYLVKRMARKVWRHCGLVVGHARYSHAGNCIGIPSKTGLFLSTGTRYLFLLQRHSFPFDS